MLRVSAGSVHDETVTVERSIERARPQDATALLQLLEENHLPVDGVREHLATTIVARLGRRVMAPQG